MAILPFSSEVPEWFSFLGEYSVIPSSFFFVVGVFLLGVYFLFGGKIFYPIKSTEYSLFTLFLVSICLCTLINAPSISDYYFKQTSGGVRFIRQLLSILLGGLAIFLLFINVCRDYGVKRFFLILRKLFLFVFALVFLCGILELIAVSTQSPFLINLVNVFNYFPFVEMRLNFVTERISATTYEPPALGTYLITTSGFLFSYILTSKSGKRFLPFVAVVILAIISKSRMALVVILFQIFIGVYLAYFKNTSFRRIFHNTLLIGGVAILILCLVFWKPISHKIQGKLESLDFTEVKFSKENNSISNKTRFGMQYASIQVIKEHPFFGVGWGQQAYESRFHYPEWATKNNYEYTMFYLNENVKDFPPSFNMYLRIMAEAGIIGFLVFLSFLSSVVLSTFALYRKHRHSYIPIALLIGFGGFLLDWFQIDSFRLFGFWLCLAILIVLKKEKTPLIN